MLLELENGVVVGVVLYRLSALQLLSSTLAAGRQEGKEEERKKMKIDAGQR